MGKTSLESKKKYNKKTYKRLSIDVKVEEAEMLEKHCAQSGESKNGCIRRLIRENCHKNKDAGE